MKPFRPYRLPLKTLKWDKLIRKIGQANAALARYDGILHGIVNPALLLSPLMTQEAVLSSRIEGTQATLEEVLEFEASPERVAEKGEDIREIINYRRAVNKAIKSLEKRPLSLNLIKEIHSVLLEKVRGRYKSRGKFRNKQNWIGNPGCPIEKATFVPPEPIYLIEHLSTFEKYLHYDEKDRLVQLAIIHAQFEMIHPFLDGNGRVGRIIIPLFLYEKGLLSSPIFYLSAYLESHRQIYYNKLQAISAEGDWEGWIEFFLEAMVEQARDNSEKAKKILALYEMMKIKIAQITHSQFSIQTLDTLFDRPIFVTSDFVRRSGIPKASAMRILGKLQKERLLITISESRGRRAAILMFAELISLVEGRSVN